MDKRVEGTFKSENEAKVEIERLISEEGYRPEELLLVTDKSDGENLDSKNLKDVKIDVVNVDDDGSFWEKVKETLSFGSYHSEEAENALEKHGVTHELSDHYLEALVEGEIVLLANSDSPVNTGSIEVQEDITNKKENDLMVDKKKDAPVDEVNTEEEDAIKDSDKENEEPSEVSTSETDDENVTDGMDPGQADDTRSEETDSEDTDDTTSEEDATDPSSSPELTGEEDSVEAEDSKRSDTVNIAKGQVKPEAKSPLNAEPKEEKEPSKNTEDPEADAEYSEDSEEAGIKSEEKN